MESPVSVSRLDGFNFKHSSLKVGRVNFFPGKGCEYVAVAGKGDIIFADFFFSEHLWHRSFTVFNRDFVEVKHVTRETLC